MADPLLPHLASQGLNRYAANYNNPLRYKDPNGHDPSDVVNGLNEFAMGVVAQVGYNNGTMTPAAQAALARQPGESGAMTTGRVVGDVISIGQGVVEAGVGGGAVGGGVAACGTGVLCAAGAPAMVAGAAVAVHGAATAATAAGQLGDKLGIVMSEAGGGQTDSRSGQVRFNPRQVQEKYSKHASDFGVEGNWSKRNAARFENALRSHIDDPNTQVIQGTYRKTQEVTHYYNPNTGLNVIVDIDGNFVSGWQLYPSQVESLLTTGDVR